MLLIENEKLSPLLQFVGEMRKKKVIKQLHILEETMLSPQQSSVASPLTPSAY